MPSAEITADFAPLIKHGLDVVFEKMPEYADQFASLDAAGNIVMANSAARNEGRLRVCVPQASDERNAALMAQANAAREASARLAMKAAGLAAPSKARTPVHPSMPISSMKPAIQATSSSVPVNSAKPRARGPINQWELLSPERRRRIARQTAHLRGDFLSTGFEPDLEFQRKPSVKLSPASAAKLKVSIGPKAWRDMLSLAQEADGDFETGGSVLGHITADKLRVSHALAPGEGAEQTYTSVKTAQDQAVIDALIAESKGDRRELGAWHSHAYGDGKPSASDMANMIADHEKLGIDHPIEIIVRPGVASGWAKPVAVAWMLTKSDYEGFDYECKTADIEVNG
jgi:proteasome lid subunit RPN8/RPN11